ncbi:MAG: hypothetical protein UZ21_OP11001000800 [Microgenomates bacterium OLB22]|nr:MAG: hypothetical protein UZ21_OP11001000800 [Microgenomates bacterium OLB22]
MFFGKKQAVEKTKTTQSIYDIKDLLAPSYVEVDFSHIQIDGVYYKSLFVIGYPRFVHPNWLSALINFDHSLNLSLYVYPTDSNETLEDLKKRLLRCKLLLVQIKIQEGQLTLRSRLPLGMLF